MGKGGGEWRMVLGVSFVLFCSLSSFFTTLPVGISMTPRHARYLVWSFILLLLFFTLFLPSLLRFPGAVLVPGRVGTVHMRSTEIGDGRWRRAMICDAERARV